MTMRHVVAGTLTALLTHRSYTALAQSQSPSPPLGSCRMTASCNVSPLFCNCENASSKASLFLFFLKFVVINISLYLYGLQRTRRGLYEFHLCELNLYFQLNHLAGASNQNEIVVRQASELSQLLPRSKMIKMECGVVDRNRIWLSAPAFGVRHRSAKGGFRSHAAFPETASYSALTGPPAPLPLPACCASARTGSKWRIRSPARQRSAPMSPPAATSSAPGTSQSTGPAGTAIPVRGIRVAAPAACGAARSRRRKPR